MIFLYLHSNIFSFLFKRDTQHAADESMFSASNEIHFPKRYDGNVFETTFLFSNQFWFVSKETNGPRARKCIEGSDGIVADNGRHNEFPSTRKPCIASSNSSSSDEFLELPFNDLSVSSGIYGAARNACYMNSNVANIASNSGSNKRR